MNKNVVVITILSVVAVVLGASLLAVCAAGMAQKYRAERREVAAVEFEEVYDDDLFYTLTDEEIARVNYFFRTLEGEDVSVYYSKEFQAVIVRVDFSLADADVLMANKPSLDRIFADCYALAADCADTAKDIVGRRVDNGVMVYVDDVLYVGGLESCGVIDFGGY